VFFAIVFQGNSRAAGLCEKPALCGLWCGQATRDCGAGSFGCGKIASSRNTGAQKLHSLHVKEEPDREYDRKSPARPGLVDDFLISSHARLIASD
jgi:hypothetical protein